MLPATDTFPVPAVSLDEDLRRLGMHTTRPDFCPKSSEEFYADVLWTTDANLRVTEASHGGRDMLGQTFLDLVGPERASEPAVMAHWQDLLARKPFRGFIHGVLKRDGSILWFEVNGDPFYTDDRLFLGYRGIARDITARRAAENKTGARAKFLAEHDGLTGLLNRTEYHTKLAQALAEMRPGAFVAALFVDLDNFKLINDSMGHPVGDALLRSVGERLIMCVRHTDTVARVDGDEFAVVQVDLTHPEEAAVLAERILQTVHEPYEVHGHRVIPTATIGIAIAPLNGIDAVQLVKNADIAQYNAKVESPGQWRFYEQRMGVRVQERRTVEAELHNALACGEFELYYQPFYNIVEQNTCAFEALIRWRHPVRGIVLPDSFIGVAEETGLIVPLGAWILSTACREAAKWPPHVSVSVNLSPVQFRGRSPVNDVRNALRDSGLVASRLELEITESVLMHDSEETLAALHDLRALGCRISMDDFGTGYSSLSYLRSFPFDKIKIDRTFIQDLDRRRGAEIVRAIATLGNSLKLATTAEGVETHEQFSIVCAEGCTEVQGYLFSEPRPAEDIPQMMGRIPEEVCFNVPDSLPPAEPATQSFFIDETADCNIFCGEAI